MKNNKGYSLIELLAVVVILGIISILTIVGYTNYIRYSKQRSYDMMAKSAAEAAEEYSMDNIGLDTVTLGELTEEQYLERPEDPGSKGKVCTGKVKITYKSNTTGLDTQEYDVSICCANYKYRYHFPGGNKTAISSCN